MSLCFKIAEHHPTIAHEMMVMLNTKFGITLQYGIINRAGLLTIVLYVVLDSEDDFAIFLLTHNDTLNSIK